MESSWVVGLAARRGTPQKRTKKRMQESHNIIHSQIETETQGRAQRETKKKDTDINQIKPKARTTKQNEAKPEQMRK